MHLIILKSWVPFTLESNDPETILSSSYWQQQTWKKTDVNYNCISQQQSTYLTLVASKREYTRNFASIPIIIDLHAISKYLSPTLSQFFMVLINKMSKRISKKNWGNTLASPPLDSRISRHRRSHNLLHKASSIASLFHSRFTRATPNNSFAVRNEKMWTFNSGGRTLK